MSAKPIIFCHRCMQVIRRSRVAKCLVDSGHIVAVGHELWKVHVTKRRGGYFASHFSLYIDNERVVQQGTDGIRDGRSKAKAEVKKRLYSNCPKCDGRVAHDQDGKPVHALAEEAARCGSIRVRWRD